MVDLSFSLCPNILFINPGLIGILSTFWVLTFGVTYIRGALIFGGHFVLVSAYKSNIF